MCGELNYRKKLSTLFAGSSPRVWGTQIVSRSNVTTIRFIPTCVGNSAVYFPCIKHVSVHPHVCGELWIDSEQDSPKGGSSPRVWGTRFGLLHLLHLIRFIPTCVGNSFFVPAKIVDNPVHPHVCGELVCLRSSGHRDIGSSPRVWGTRRGDSCGNVHRPVHPHVCGELIGPLGYQLQCSVHPHVCGELGQS